MSLRQQLQDPGKKPVAYQHFINKDKDKDKDKDATAGGTASRHVSF
jgi:WD repeat-containing protein 20